MKTFEQFNAVNENRGEEVSQNYYDEVLNAFKHAQREIEQILFKYARIEKYTTEGVLKLIIHTEEVSIDVHEQVRLAIKQNYSNIVTRNSKFKVAAMVRHTITGNDDLRPLEIQIWSDF